MTEHHLKVQEPYYTALAQGRKPFEVRKNDRAYQVGDVLHLHMFDIDACGMGGRRCSHDSGCPGYLGSSRTRVVSFVYSGDPRFGGGIEPGYVVLGLEDPEAIA